MKTTTLCSATESNRHDKLIKEETKIKKKTLITIISIATTLFMFQSISYADDWSWWLGSHNAYRSVHESTPDLVYDFTLAGNAEAYANSCPDTHSGDVGVGENILWTVTNTPDTPEDYVNIIETVSSWYNEIDDYDYNNPGYSDDTGHFTQVVWKNTERIGCAYNTKPCSMNVNGHEFNRVYVCQYSPAGNFPGQFEANVKPLIQWIIRATLDTDVGPAHLIASTLSGEADVTPAHLITSTLSGEADVGPAHLITSTLSGEADVDLGVTTMSANGVDLQTKGVGLQNYERVYTPSEYFTIPADGWHTSEVTCPGNKVVLGGGGHTSTRAWLEMVSSFPYDDHTWYVRWHNNRPFEITKKLQVFALCADE